MSTAQRPQRIGGLVLHETGGDVLVHDRDHAKIHVLNAAAGRILSLCDGERSLTEIVEAVDCPGLAERPTVERDVRTLLLEFDKLHLLERA